MAWGWHDAVMANVDDIRRIALSFPETDEHPSYNQTVSFRVKKKGFTRIREDGESLVLFTATLEEKEEFLKADPLKFFTTPHYDGYPAILLRFAEVDVDELRELLADSWRVRAPARLRAAFEATEASG